MMRVILIMIVASATNLSACLHCAWTEVHSVQNTLVSVFSPVPMFATGEHDVLTKSTSATKPYSFGPATLWVDSTKWRSSKMEINKNSPFHLVNSDGNIVVTGMVHQKIDSTTFNVDTLVATLKLSANDHPVKIDRIDTILVNGRLFREIVITMYLGDLRVAMSWFVSFQDTSLIALITMTLHGLDVVHRDDIRNLISGCVWPSSPESKSIKKPDTKPDVRAPQAPQRK